MDQVSPDAAMIVFSLVVFFGLSFNHLEMWWDWIKFHWKKGGDKKVS